MKKIITMCLSMMCLLTTAFAQYKHYNEETKQWKEYTSYEEYIFDESQFIFEGTVVKSEGYWSEKDKMIYTSNIIKIEKIFRGKDKIKLGTVEIVTRGGKVENRGYEFPNEGAYMVTGKSIFFCIPSNYDTSTILADNSIRLKSLTRITYQKSTDRAYGPFKQFKEQVTKWNEVYIFLNKHKNISIFKEEIQPAKKKDVAGSLNERKEQNKIRYARNVRASKKYMQQLQTRIDAQQAKSANSCKEFFFSEYIDGPNAPKKNKVLEIYNPSDSIKSLNGYSIKIFNNGAPTPIDIPLSGNVNPKETYVVAHPNAEASILTKADQTDVKMNFDGNDAIVLNKGQSTYIDKIGEIGVNPGQGGWNVPPGGSTKDRDLRRKYPIDKGETDWNQGKNQWDVLPKDSLANIKKHDNVCQTAAAVEDLNLSFANPIETGTNPKYFEFDLMVAGSSNNTYFDNAVIELDYNTTAFGSSIASNMKVIVTRSIAFNNSSYIDPNTMITDASTSTIKIPFGSNPNVTSWNRTLVTTNPMEMLHVKIEIQNCGQTTDILFSNTGFNPLFSRYTTTAGDDPFNALGYDNTNYSSGLTYTLCPPPVINTFTSPVYPGTYYDGTIETKHILTIQGSGFGATRGTGNVYFVNANNPEIINPYQPLNTNDFTTWSDTQIKIIMPSVIDSTNLAINPTPGSGIFYLVTNAGDTAYSNTPIDMPYAIKNAIDPLVTNGKIRMDLVNKTDSIGYEFYFGPSITNYPDSNIRVVLKQAIKDWACNTLINIVFKGDTSIDVSTGDNVSVIHLVTSFPNNTTLAETSFGIGGACGDIGGNKHVFPTEIDIAFLADPSTIGAGTWFYDITGNPLPAGNRDFYEVAVHEVGHGNLLSHVNNVNDVMFYTGKYDPSNDISGNNRRWISTNDANGGIDVVERSKTITYNGSCSYQTSSYVSAGLSCSGTTIVIEQSEALNALKVFPNPSTDGFTINYELTKNTPVQFRLYDYMGREIKNYNSTIESNGTHQKYIETQGLSTGLYFLVANIGGKRQTMKIIKQ